MSDRLKIYTPEDLAHRCDQAQVKALSFASRAISSKQSAQARGEASAFAQLADIIRRAEFVGWSFKENGN